MAKSCIFCGNKLHLTHEHAWPVWFSNMFSNSGYFLVEGEHLKIRNWKYQSKRINLTINNVCRECNTGWMSNLEFETKPILEPMIIGKETLLSSLQQKIISKWAIKTEMVFEFTGSVTRKNYFTIEDRKKFYLKSLFPINTIIWLSAYIGKHACYARDHNINLILKERNQFFSGYVSTFSLGQLVFQVFSHKCTREIAGTHQIAFKFPKQWETPVVQIYPFLKNQIWPPVEVLNEEGLDLFQKRWSTLIQ